MFFPLLEGHHRPPSRKDGRAAQTMLPWRRIRRFGPYLSCRHMHLGIFTETSGDINAEPAGKKHSENWLLSNEVVGHLESKAS